MKACFLFIILAICEVLPAQTLFEIVYTNDLKSLKEYEGAVNLRDENQATPLMWAAYRANKRMFKKLVKMGADISMKGWILHRDTLHNYEFIYGSILAIAAGENNTSLLRYLLHKNRVDVNDREVNLYENSENGWTGLHWAAVKGNVQAARILISKGADINAQARTDFNQTPLILAINFDQFELVDLLLSKGANCNQGDMYGISVLTYAFETESRELVKLIVKYGAEFNALENKKIDKQLMEVFGIMSIKGL